MRRSLTIFLLFLFSFVQPLTAQFSGCGPDQPGAPFCEQACIRCEIKGLQDITDFAPPIPNLTIDQCFFGTPPITLQNPK
ncbi:MAG: hypothetical protein L6Q97_18345, partial [Thermoanaerobaculia bacterium]|nr:hypothetical protein [Thermoanaerobaculia bacterium]